MNTADTKAEIMSNARKMVQSRGYGALSFRDLATAVGVKSSSVHYHFPTKGDLAAALARQYADEAAEFLNNATEASSDPKACMQSYVKRFRTALENGNRMCLCGIMAAEYDALPIEVKKEIDRFNQIHVEWLERVLSLKKSTLTKNALRKRATAIFAAFQGAQLIARGQNDISVYDESIEAYRAAGLFP